MGTRARRKAELVAARGGVCEICGYSRTAAALDLHHCVATEKVFALGDSRARSAEWQVEAAKCALLCANCHRTTHAATRRRGSAHPVVEWRRRTKVRAVALLGGRCAGCGFDAEITALDFHHRDGGTKEFAFSVDGVPRAWRRIVGELEKCVLLCANCHREVHAGARALAAVVV